ncbi:hypothetical protein EXIGLDRAFT_627873, partial [Exidia glandulosa HHB12029]
MLAPIRRWPPRRTTRKPTTSAWPRRASRTSRARTGRASGLGPSEAASQPTQPPAPTPPSHRPSPSLSPQQRLTGSRSPRSRTLVRSLYFILFVVLISTGFERYLRVEQPAGELAALSLMRVGMMACTPWVPVVAISVNILKMYYYLRRRAPRLGVQPFVRALCDTYNYFVLMSDVPRQLTNEEALVIPGFLAMDGGQSNRRNASAGLADPRAFDSDYRIPPEEVDLYANEVQRRISKQREEPEAPAYTTLEESGEPGDDAPKPSICASRWKNAKAEHNKLAPGMFDQTGVFALLCRHGLVLWFLEMIRSGELAKYPLAMIARLIRAGFRDKRNGYDIGCAFQGTLERSALLGDRAREAGIKCGVNAFHGYGHNRMCQLRGHPLYEDGFGLEDLEVCERFFSWLNGVAGVFLCNNVKQAKLLQAEFAPLVATFKSDSGLTDADIEGWNAAELAYLEGLQTEPEEVALTMDYVMMLSDLEEADDEEIAARRLSPAAVKKLYKARVDAYDRYTKTRDAVVALEAVLGIDERWTTRYKLREAIGKGLKSRSQAIRTAVTRYNELAAVLVPPAPTVDFSTLMEW